MVFFNYTTMQMTAKIVYYGPGLCGKTTNLQFIHQKTAPKSRGEMVSLETETDRTLFFDLLPLDVGVIGGMKLRLQLYTVPGQVFYNATRKLVLKGVDGIVFVADSQNAALDANVESLGNLEANLAELHLALNQIPIVFQYNKRDIRNILSVERLNETLNTGAAPHFEAAALHGIGVFETLKSISRLALTSIRRKVTEEAKKKAAAEPPLADLSAVLNQPPAAPRTSAKAMAAATVDPLAELVADVPRAEDLPVEFAEEDTDRHAVRAVPTKAQLDIQDELQKLRALTTAATTPRPASSPAGSPDIQRRLQDMLVSDLESRQDVKRKASIEVPGRLMRDSSALRIHIGFDGGGDEQLVRDAVTVKLVGNRRLERLTLHLDLELKGKT